MAGDLERRLERRRGEAGRARFGFRPVIVVGGGVDAGDALVARLRAGARGEVAAMLVRRAGVGLRGQELPVGRGVEAPAAADRWPARGRTPLLGVHGEVM